MQTFKSWPRLFHVLYPQDHGSMRLYYHNHLLCTSLSHLSTRDRNEHTQTHSTHMGMLKYCRSTHVSLLLYRTLLKMAILAQAWTSPKWTISCVISRALVSTLHINSSDTFHDFFTLMPHLGAGARNESAWSVYVEIRSAHGSVRCCPVGPGEIKMVNSFRHVTGPHGLPFDYIFSSMYECAQETCSVRGANSKLRSRELRCAWIGSEGNGIVNPLYNLLTSMKSSVLIQFLPLCKFRKLHATHLCWNPN